MKVAREPGLRHGESVPPWLHATATGIELLLHVQPRASRTRIAGEHGGRLKVQLAAPPVDGAANDELVRFLAELLAVPRRSVALVSGEGSRDKRVAVAGVTPEQALRPLAGR